METTKKWSSEDSKQERDGKGGMVAYGGSVYMMRTQNDRPKAEIKPNRLKAKKCPNFIYFTFQGSPFATLQNGR